jgi:hypothetical protein
MSKITLGSQVGMQAHLLLNANVQMI